MLHIHTMVSETRSLVPTAGMGRNGGGGEGQFPGKKIWINPPPRPWAAGAQAAEVRVAINPKKHPLNPCAGCSRARRRSRRPWSGGWRTRAMRRAATSPNCATWRRRRPTGDMFAFCLLPFAFCFLPFAFVTADERSRIPASSHLRMHAGCSCARCSCMRVHSTMKRAAVPRSSGCRTVSHHRPCETVQGLQYKDRSTRMTVQGS